MREVAGQFAAEPAGGHAPVVAAMAVTNAEPARHRIRVGGHGLGDEVVVLARRQLFQADGLLELADLQVLAATAERVLDVGVEELVGLGVVADNPFDAARALALEHELGAADRKSTRLNSSQQCASRMTYSA